MFLLLNIMVVSIYVCEIPRNINKKDIENLFSDYDGYVETRMKGTNDNRKIAFVDYENEKDAIFVIETLQSFRFAPEDKGLILKISDNSKAHLTNKDDSYLKHKKPRTNSYDRSEHHYKHDNKKEETKQSNNAVPDLLSLLVAMNQNTKPQPTNNYMPDQNMPSQDTNVGDIFQNLQTLQLLQTIASANNNPPKAKVDLSSELQRYDNTFKNMMDFRKQATNIVYVEGLPNDVTEREVAHIFRPFPGFKSVRLITKDKKGEKSILCFADFEDITQSTVCINTLQGYRFDKNDLVGLHFSYGISKSRR
jgi:RNA recognition motif-containing protein